MRKLKKSIALFTIAAMLYQILFPSVAYALTGGPSQPEVASFTPVGVSDMVNTFTGDFTYNIPLMDVGGYPINISYASGIGMDQEASWVGLGWTLNPGSITRQLRGLPDDFKGDPVVKKFNMKPDRTAGIVLGASFELAGKSIPKKLQLGGNLSIFHNSYKGYGTSLGLAPSITAAKSGGSKLSVGLGLDFNSQEGMSASASANFSQEVGKQDVSSFGLGGGVGSRSGLKEVSFNLSATRQGYRNVNAKDENGNDIVKGQRVSASMGSASSSVSFGSATYNPKVEMPMKTTAFAFNASLGLEVFPSNPTFRLTGYGSVTELQDKYKELPAYGYIYSNDGKGNNNVIHDFNRRDDVPYVADKPVLAFPVYTYDLFSVNGEGMNGQFRSYRSSVGILYDAQSSTTSSNTSIGAHIGAFNAFKGGADLDASKVNVTNGIWSSSNAMVSQIRGIGFDENQEATYFKNVGEKSAIDNSYTTKMGDGRVIQPFVASVNSLKNYCTTYDKALIPAAPVLIDGNNKKDERERRRRTFSFLSAAEATNAGLDRSMSSYTKNLVSLNATSSRNGVSDVAREDSKRLAHHMSEIRVTDESGKRYIYGIAAYNNVQREVTFAVNDPSGSVPSNGLVSYTTENSSANTAGRDNFYSCEQTPGYAHSYLLTGVLSPDYIDLTGDGISTDDPGDAVKFNYTKYKDDYKWRMPVTPTTDPPTKLANFSIGLRSNTLPEENDNKASYIYGEKEVWYLHSIESKTMLAQFILDDRLDGCQSNSEDGEVDESVSLQRLTQIRLYSKADLVKYGAYAVPVKTVHFVYDYSMCKGIPNSKNFDSGNLFAANSGKLTLKKIYFTYGTNNSGAINPYVFQYTDSTKYNYDYRKYDRWGNYNEGAGGSYPNTTEYPYTIQNQSLADEWSQAWHLTAIETPSGSQINVGYESKDYAYVQNKRAGQMFFIKKTNGPSGQENYLYNGNSDYNTFYFEQIGTPLTLKSDIYKKYLDGCDGQLYFNCLVNLSGGAQEYINGFAEIEDYGASGSDFWVRVKKASSKGAGDVHPIAKAAWDFTRMNLPNLAYGGSAVTENIGDAILQMIGVMSEMITMIGGIDNKLKGRESAKTFDLDKSWVRLANPDFKKLGGGCRVKQITYNDNWNHITGGTTRTYGTKYEYTTTITEGTSVKTISSGVAAWEPELGGDENPFKQPVNYSQSKPLSPTSHFFVTQPLGEGLYPAPIIGYSKVQVKPIGAEDEEDVDDFKRTAPGFSVYEYYTAKDFPVIAMHTTRSVKESKTRMPVGGLMYSKSKDWQTVSQGYLVENNDMHGKQKSVTELDALGGIITKTRYIYKEITDPENGAHRIDNAATVINSKGVLEETEIGKEVDTWIDFRESNSNVGGMNMNFNTESFVLPIVIPLFILFPPILPKFRSEHTRFRSAVAVKLVNRFGLLDKVIVEKDGAAVTTENIAYDKVTGEVLLTKTTNEFNDALYSFTYPAYWIYNNMGPVYGSEKVSFKNKAISGGTITGMGTMSSLAFNEGDELLLHSNTVSQRAWISVDDGGTTLIVDDNGYKVNGLSGVDITVVRSGSRNQLLANAGQFVTSTDPVKIDGSLKYIDIEDGDKVISLSSTEYNDTWKINCEKIPYSNYPHPYCPTEDEKQCLVDLLNALISPTYCETVFNTGDPFPISTLTSLDDDCMLKTEAIPHMIFHPEVDRSPQELPTTWYLQGLNTQFCLVLIPKTGIGPVEIDCDLENCSFDFNSNCELILKNEGGTDIGAVKIYDNCGDSETNSWCVDKINPGDVINPYLLGIKNKWKPVKQIAYNGSRDAVEYTYSGPLSSISTAGYIDDDNIKYWDNDEGTEPFHKNSSLSAKWIESSEVTLINRRSEELENKDALGIYSSALFGYEEYYPVAMAGNTQYREVANDNFEDYGFSLNPIKPCWMDHFSFRTAINTYVTIADDAHTGLHSLRIENSHSAEIERPLMGEMGDPQPPLLANGDHLWELNDGCIDKFSPYQQKSYLVSLWVKDEDVCSGFSNVEGYVNIYYDGSSVTGSFYADGPVVEGWQRIEGVFTVPSSATSITIRLVPGVHPEASLFDDIRVMPLDGGMKTFVYNPVNLRLMAELDDNNYATFYEYDDEGKLIRVKKETERGVMTLKESRTVLHEN